MYSSFFSKQTIYSWWVDSLLLLLALGGLFFILLGSRPLFVPDEGRYAEIAREMVVSGDYLTPHLNGIKYFEKPVLFYWFEALAIQLAGLNLWSIRSINALLGLAGCLLTYGTARKVYDRLTGLIAAFMLGTSLLYVFMARMITLDLPVTVFLSATLYLFILGLSFPKSAARYYLWIGTFSAACATLTKGLIGIVFPVLIISSWLTLIGEWNRIKTIPFFSCSLIFCAIVLPWHLVVGINNPEFFYFYFIEQHFLRYLSPDIGHFQPVWFFIPILFIGFFPWILFLPPALVNTIRNIIKKIATYQIDSFFLIWFSIIFLFFSFSKSKLIPYILPAFPPLAILIANYIVQILWTKWRITIMSLFFITATFLLLVLIAFPRFDSRTIAPLALQIKPLLKPDDEVLTLNQYYQDLPFYIERRVSIVNWRNELSFGMAHQSTKDWMIDTKEFWTRFGSKKRLFVFSSLDEYEKLKLSHPYEKYHVLAKTLNTILFSNQKSPNNAQEQPT